MPDWINIQKDKKTASLTPYKGDKNKSNYVQTIEEIAKSEWMKPAPKQWLIEIDSYLSQNVPYLSKEINNKNENYHPVVSYKDEENIWLSLVPKISQINVYWNFKERPSDKYLLELLNEYQVEYSEKGHRGKGNWHFPLINSNDSCQHLKNFIQQLQVYYKLN